MGSPRLHSSSAVPRSADYPDTLRRLVHQLAADEQVIFTGQVSDATPYYSLMDVLVNASDPEPFGIALVEGMAAGLPVVAYSRGGPAEILDTGVTGILVEG